MECRRTDSASTSKGDHNNNLEIIDIPNPQELVTISQAGCTSSDLLRMQKLIKVKYTVNILERCTHYLTFKLNLLLSFDQSLWRFCCLSVRELWASKPSHARIKRYHYFFFFRQNWRSVLYVSQWIHWPSSNWCTNWLDRQRWIRTLAMRKTPRYPNT